MKELVDEKPTNKIRGILTTVHSTLGPSFRDETYKRASILELKKQGLRVEPERGFDIRYDGQIIN